jgi:hypothetical protein
MLCNIFHCQGSITYPTENSFQSSEMSEKNKCEESSFRLACLIKYRFHKKEILFTVESL